MSQSTLKLKNFEIFNLLKYYDTDDVLTEEEDIVDMIYEYSTDSKSIVTFTFLLSKGQILYIEYDLLLKKLIKFFSNTVLISVLSNSITKCLLSHSTPLLLSTSLNEVVIVDSKVKPQQIITLTEENVNIYSAFCNNSILEIRFNCNQEYILAICSNTINIYKIVYDKVEMKNVLNLVLNINSFNCDDYSLVLNYTLSFNFSNYYDNLLLVSYVVKEELKTINNSSISIKPQDLYLESSFNNNNNNINTVFLYLMTIQINKKDYILKPFKLFKTDSTFIKKKFSLFYDKLVLLYDNGIMMCVDNENENKNDSNKPLVTSKGFFTNPLIFKHITSSDIKFKDVFFHPSNSFIAVLDSYNEFLFFDYTLNLYYILTNSQILINLKMNFEVSEFRENNNVNNTEDNNELSDIQNKNEIKSPVFKCWELYHLHQITKINNNNNNVLKTNAFTNSTKVEEIEEFNYSDSFKTEVYNTKIKNNCMFFFDNKKINGVLVEINSTFQKNIINNSNNNNNNNVFSKTNNESTVINSFDLLKNHLKGNNFESSIRVLRSINSFNTWIQSFLMLVNKLTQSTNYILLTKRHVLAEFLDYIASKNFNDDNQNNTIVNLKLIAFTNLLYRCLSIKQYEYAFLIADKLNSSSLYKTIVSHSKQSKFLGVAYLCCSKIEEQQTENDDSVINDINKIMSNSNFVLSQANMQNMLRDIDHLLENNNLNSDYLKEHNTLELNLNNYMEGLKMEMMGKFEEAKDIYKKNGLNYDLIRVDKVMKELKNQITEDSIHELNDF